MKKFKVFYNFQEEEKWLSDMAKNGHILKSYSTFGIYTFAEDKPQALNYKIDYKTFTQKSDYISYLTLFEDAGWQHVWGTKNSGSHYFLPKNGQADAEIFSDAESSNKRYKTFFELCVTNLSLWSASVIAIIYNYDFSFSNFGFLTPGLWDKVGAAFWKSFLFELPFVIGRAGFFLVFLAMGILYGYWAMKAKKEYDRLAKEKENNK